MMIKSAETDPLKNHPKSGKMMTAVIFKNQKIEIRKVPVPTPASTEALVKINLAGICATDAELLNGYHEFSGIPGHEFVGRVVWAPDHPDLEGQRVAADINFSCGRCGACRAGNYRHCGKRTVLGIRGRNGIFAEFCAIPAANLYPVPDEIMDQDAVFAEPLAAAMAVERQAEISSTADIAVLGDGIDPDAGITFNWISGSLKGD